MTRCSLWKLLAFFGGNNCLHFLVLHMTRGDWSVLYVLKWFGFLKLDFRADAWFSIGRAPCSRSLTRNLVHFQLKEKPEPRALALCCSSMPDPIDEPVWSNRCTNYFSEIQDMWCSFELIAPFALMLYRKTRDRFCFDPIFISKLEQEAYANNRRGFLLLIT